PIASAFVFIGILLVAYYQKDPTYQPKAAADIFGSYILNVMPVGVRGLVLAGIFATAMGSFSAALNALATAATNDWYIRWVRGKSEAHYVKAARWFTVLFAVLMIVIAGGFAYAKVTNPSVRIIPVVLGIAGFILGPMLGVFLIGMLTRTRGSDTGNMLAITIGLLTTIYLGNLHVDFLNLLGPSRLSYPAPHKSYKPKPLRPRCAALSPRCAGVSRRCAKTSPRCAANAKARAMAKSPRLKHHVPRIKSDCVCDGCHSAAWWKQPRMARMK